MSHTTVSKALSSPAVPGWGTLELLVESMGGDVSRFRDLWLAASQPAGSPARTAHRIAGRRRELDVVRNHVESGSGLFLVTGEAGIGKTTLVTAVAESVDTFVATGHCLQLSSEVPLLPVIEMLRAVLRVEDGQWFKEALAECPAYVSTSLSRLLPELDAGSSPPIADDPWGLEKLYGAVNTVVQALASTRPFAVHIEDGHWADRSTLDLLSHLASNPPRCPLVLTWRSGDPDVSDRHDEWLSTARWTFAVPTVDLRPMTPEETAEQLQLLTGSTSDTDTSQRIHARSRGLPLYTEQLASTADTGELPKQLAELLDRRIGDLAGDAWQVAKVLGVAQRRIGPPLLQAASGLDPEQLADGMRGLVRRGLLRKDTGADAEMAHPLFVDAIQRRLLPGEAIPAHARLAEALSNQPDIEPAEIAGHWQAGGRPDLEVDHRVAAAVRAVDRFAYREALDAWLRVLQLWDAGARPDHLDLGYLVKKALEAVCEIGDLDAGRTLVARANALDLSDREHAGLLTQVGVFLIDDGQADQGLAHLDEALSLLEDGPPSPDLAEVLGERVNYFMQSGRYREAAVDLRRLDELFSVDEDTRSKRRRLAASIWLDAQAGNLEKALTTAQDVLAAQLTEPDPYADLMVAANTTGIMLVANKPPPAITEVARGPLIAADASNLTRYYPAVLVRANVASAYLRSGDVRTARECLTPVTSSPVDLNTADAHMLLGAVELREGDLSSALERCRLADAQVLNRNQNWAEGVPGHAEVLLWAGRVGAAVDLLAEAVEISLPTEAVTNTAALLCQQARAVGDRLEKDKATVEERRVARLQLQRLLAKAHRNPFKPYLHHAASRAMSDLWQAELARVEGVATTRLWVRAAGSFDRLDWPHDAAYCRWRAATTALHAEEGTRRSRLLKQAATQARRHAPLAVAIAAASRSAGTP